MELTPLSRKREIALSVENSIIMHLSADIEPKAIILLIADGEDTIVAVISQVNLVTNVSK